MAIYAVGDLQRPEFHGLAPLLGTHAAVAEFADLGQLARATAAPDLCVLFQSVPNAISSRQLESLLSRWPLARFVTVAGPLCEGEPRTGRPWPGQLRVYWHEFPGWWSLQVARVAAGQCPEWGLPRTSREDDLLRGAQPTPWLRNEGLIGVAANSWNESSRLLLDIVRDAGLNGCRLSLNDRTQVAGLRAILWDDNDPAGNWRATFDRLHARWPGTPIVALLNFPRVEDRALVRNAVGDYPGGAILAKPYDLDTLLSTLAALPRVTGTMRKS